MNNRNLHWWKFVVLIFSFFTGIAFAQPVTTFTESFDTVTTPALPAGWTGHLEVLLSNTAAQVTTTMHGMAPSPPNATFIMNGIDGSNGQLDPTAFAALISPLAEVGPNGATVSFWGTGGNPIQVGTMTNPTDASTFVLVQEVPLNYNFEQHSVTISAPGIKYIAFKHGNVNAVTPLFLDDISFDQIIPALAAFSENFDAVTPPALPAGWTGHLEVLLSNTAAQVTTTMHGMAPSQPNASFIMNGIDGSNGQLDPTAFAALISPFAEVGPNGATVSFWGTGGNPIQVGTMTDPADASTFVLVQEVPLNYNFEQHSVTISAPGNKYIAFKHGNVNAVTPLFLDDISFAQIIPGLTSFTENFDGITPPALPAGWAGHLEVLLSNTAAQVTTTMHGMAPSQPNASFIMNGIDGSNGQLDPTAFAALISPLAEVGPNGATISFWGTGGNPIQIGTMTDPTDASTFVLVQEVPLNYNFEQHSVTISAPGTKYIALKHGNVNAVTPLFLDNIVFDQLTAPTTFPLTVNVSNGWNMVSIPGLHPQDQNVQTWWPGKDPAAGVFRFQGGYQPVISAAPGTGYWMKNIGAQIYNTGDEWPSGGIQIVNHNPVQGYSGWNMIGGYELSVPTSGLTTTPEGLITGSIYKYASGYVVANSLEPGYGYWIKLTGDGDINIPSVNSKGINSLNTQGFAKVIITDNNQNSYTLYSANGSTELAQFDLPPAPPAGMFDIRYASQRFAEDLSTPQTIEMTGVQYPVKIKAEGKAIVLSDETGKEIARLKSGEEITLNNVVNKLMVSANTVPSVYSLEQNYPNPFNPSTTIQFSIPEDANNVKLLIYNALGEKVAELVNSPLQAGNYKYSFNASKLSSGIYIYQLVSEKFVSTRKMTLLK